MSAYFNGMNFKEYLVYAYKMRDFFQELIERLKDIAIGIAALVVNVPVLLTMPIWVLPVTWLSFVRQRKKFTNKIKYKFAIRNSAENCDDCKLYYFCRREVSKYTRCKGGKTGSWVSEPELPEVKT
jgi:hypothetical protein